MTKKIAGVVLIEPEPDGKCEFCGKIAELRPYGPKEERICFECGMKDASAAKRAFHKMLGSGSA